MLDDFSVKTDTASIGKISNLPNHQYNNFYV